MTGTGMAFNLDGTVAAINSIVGQVTGDKEIWLFAVIAAVTLAVVFIIGQIPFDYAWYVAIIAGGVAEVVVTFFCAAALSVNVNIIGVVIGTVVGVLLAVVLQFFKCVVDYSRKEYVQFEDDDYYYYVKAVPKISVAEPEKSVVKMNVKKSAEAKAGQPEDEE